MKSLHGIKNAIYLLILYPMVKFMCNKPCFCLSSVVRQKSFYFVCHSGLAPESSVSELDSRFRGNDDFLRFHQCWTY